MPTTGARGTRAFCPSQATAPQEAGDDDDQLGECVPKTLEDVAGPSQSNQSEIDITHDLGLPGTPARKQSSLAGKCKYSAVLDDLQSPEPSSIDSSDKVPDSSSFTSSDPTKKKVVRAPSKLASKITPAAAISGMQGSINHLTNIFEQAMVPPDEAGSSSRNHALQLLQEVDDNLSTEEKVKMISFFMLDIVTAETYLSLVDTDLRQAWIKMLLAEN